MSNDPLHAEAETAWAMAYASDEGLRAMCSIAPQEVVRLAWIMGHYKGKLAGAIAAQVIYADAMIARDRAKRYEGGPEHDLNARGEPAKPGQ